MEKVEQGTLTLEQRIESIKQQQKTAEEVFIKCAGAIEVLEGILKESQGDSNQD